MKFASTTTATAATTAYGKTPKVAVTVKGSHGVAPTGKVTVKEGSTVLGTGTLDASGKVTLGLSNHLKVATHTLSVSYGGTAKLNASSAKVSLKITKATPSISTTAPSSVSHTARAKVTVKVTATGTTPTGTVRVYEGTKVIATGTLSGGKVAITLPKLSRGKHTLHAFYAGSSTVSSKSGAGFTIKST
ncbi:Ig-like domain-containing protein [Streptomyces sp. NPDC002523]